MPLLINTKDYYNRVFIEQKSFEEDDSIFIEQKSFELFSRRNLAVFAPDDYRLYPPRKAVVFCSLFKKEACQANPEIRLNIAPRQSTVMDFLFNENFHHDLIYNGGYTYTNHKDYLCERIYYGRYREHTQEEEAADASNSFLMPNRLLGPCSCWGCEYFKSHINSTGESILPYGMFANYYMVFMRHSYAVKGLSSKVIMREINNIMHYCLGFGGTVCTCEEAHVYIHFVIMVNKETLFTNESTTAQKPARKKRKKNN